LTGHHNELAAPLFGGNVYAKLQTRWHIHCWYGWLNSLSRTLLQLP